MKWRNESCIGFLFLYKGCEAKMKPFLTAMKEVWKLIVLLLLIAITFSYAMFQGGFVSWFLFYSFLPFALYALLLSFYPLKRIEAVRTLSRNESIAGERLKVSITIKRKSVFPLLFFIIEDYSSEKLHGKNGSVKSFQFPGFKRELNWEYEIAELPRGEFVFEAVRIVTGDPLGLIEKERMIPIMDKVLVYPAYEELIYRPSDSRYDQGMAASRERIQRDTSMAVGIREYQPGDRFSWINWKATAKRNDFMTKEFEQRQSHEMYLILDCEENPRFEAAVSFSASFIRAVLHHGAQIGFLSAGKERTAFPVKGGETQLLQLFYHLAKVQDNSLFSIDKVIEAESSNLHKATHLTIVTANITRDLVDKAGSLVLSKKAVTICLVKSKNESLTQQELLLKSAANSRGIKIALVHEGHFSSGLTEVVNLDISK